MKKDSGGVVDSQLRVYGVKGLRVVDASIFPLIPATHTSSTVYAVAEKVNSYLPFCFAGAIANPRSSLGSGPHQGVPMPKLRMP